MLVLGLNAFGHDAAAVLLADGRPVHAASEERIDRVRHSAAFPAGAIAAALASAGASPADVDLVAFPWTRGMARVRKALHVLAHLPRSRAFLREPPDDLLPDRRGYLEAMSGLVARVRALGIRAPIRRFPHHLAHAASAALALPDARGAVLTADGMGEWTTAATWDVRAGRPRRLRRASYPHSPGKAYAAVTRWLGFRPEADEGKTMGLAAYGDPDSPRARFARSLFAPDRRRLLRVDLRRFGFPWGEARLYGDDFLEALGPAREPDEPVREGDADVARGIQDAVEAFALAAARSVVAETGASDLSVAGGLFLNCAANGALRRALADTGTRVLPFPAAGDSGAAWGAAALAHLEATGRPASPLETLRLGHGIDDSEALAALTAGVGTPPLRLATEDLAQAVARRILEGRLVGVARGRAEFGPRALGGRSVFARADDPAVRDRLNDHKGRERWRPVAPVLRTEDVSTWFEGAVESPSLQSPSLQSPSLQSPWMILTLPATAAARAGPLAGAIHADGTARVQTVTAVSEPFLYSLLTALSEHGHVAVVNTSLNRRGEPIVDTAAQALEAARAMRLDALVVGDRLSDFTTRESR